MLTRILLVLTYITKCLRLGVGPWRYFQLNAPYFNEAKGIFSKLEMDQLIAERWRLEQNLDTDQFVPKRFPVFSKPEWGQNSSGVERADSLEQLQKLRSQRNSAGIRYLVQEAAQGKLEIEVFSIAAPNDPALTSSRSSNPGQTPCEPAVISVTLVHNTDATPLPVNGIYNKTTSYEDITESLSPEQLTKLWASLSTIGAFRISRFGIRADSIEALINGNFKIFEINLFVPMPLILVAYNRSALQKLNFIDKSISALALSTAKIPTEQVSKPIFFNKLSLMRKIRKLSVEESTQ